MWRRSSKRIAKRLRAGFQLRMEPRPFIRNIPHRQINQLKSSLIDRINTLKFETGYCRGRDRH